MDQTETKKKTSPKSSNSTPNKHFTHRGLIRRWCCPEGTQSCGGSVLHTQLGQSEEHFKVLKILSCPLFCLCGGGHQKNTGPSTIRLQDFALVGSNKAEQISNIYIISFGETSRQSQKYQCSARPEQGNKHSSYWFQSCKDTEVCPACAPEGAQDFSLSSGKRCSPAPNQSPTPPCKQEEREALKKW